MAKFLTTSGISSGIEEIIKNARTQIVIVSPYLKLTQNFFERFKDADNQNIPIIFLYGKDQLTEDIKLQLSKMSNLKLYYYANLHAKCYLNESDCIITSMNLYEFSEKNNREMGIRVSSMEDAEIFNAAISEIQSILSASVAVDMSQWSKEIIKKEEKSATPVVKTIVQPKPVVQSASPSSFIGNLLGSLVNTAMSIGKTEGHCIRCASVLPFNPEKPLCYSCYQSWSQFSNIDYPEKFCHNCGKSHRTSFARPECSKCFTR